MKYTQITLTILSSLLTITLHAQTPANPAIQPSTSTPVTPVSPDAAPPVDEMAQARATLGITQVSTQADSTIYALSSLGQVLISKATFASFPEAKAFCDGKPGWQLTNIELPVAFGMMGVPFAEAHASMRIEQNILGAYVGAAYWFEPRPQELADLKDDKNGLAVFQANDFFGLWLNLNGSENPNVFLLSKYNERLKKANLPPLKVPAICIDKQIREFYDSPSDTKGK